MTDTTTDDYEESRKANEQYVVPNAIAKIMSATHYHIINGTFIEQLTPHQYTTREVQKLIDSEVAKAKRILLESLIDKRKPTHGPCCTCQTCGYDFDNCACDFNHRIEHGIAALPKEGQQA